MKTEITPNGKRKIIKPTKEPVEPSTRHTIDFESSQTIYDDLTAILTKKRYRANRVKTMLQLYSLLGGWIERAGYEAEM